MFAGGNVFYALLGLLPRGEVKIRVWMMLVSRFIVGSGTGEIKLRLRNIRSLSSTICSAINAASRYYVSAATLLSERTTHIALFSLFQTVGFILGPGLMVS